MGSMTPVRFLAPRVQRNNLVQETLHSCRFSQGFTESALGVPPPWRRPSWAGWRVSGEMLWCRVVLTSTWSQCIRIWLESIVLTSFFGDYMWRHWSRARTFLLSLVFSIQAPSLSLAICSSSGGSEPHHGFASSWHENKICARKGNEETVAKLEHLMPHWQYFFQAAKQIMHGRILTPNGLVRTHFWEPERSPGHPSTALSRRFLGMQPHHLCLSARYIHKVSRSQGREETPATGPSKLWDVKVRHEFILASR